MKYKTSTRISIIFSIFTFFIISFILLSLYVFSFFWWYNKEKSELLEKIDLEYSEILEDKKDHEQKEELVEELDDMWWFMWDLVDKLKYKKVLLNIYKTQENTYLLFIKKETKFGPVFVSDDISPYLINQFRLMKIWFLLLILATILSYFISKFLFIRYALKDIFVISDRLKNIDLNNIKKINLDIPEDDEINTILSSINTFLEIIDKNTKSLKQFNSSVAHEFKTPLMIISSELEFLSIWEKNNTRFSKIEEQLNSLNTLLETFLFISKIENSKWVIKKDNIDLKNIIDEKINYYQDIYKDKKILVDVSSESFSFKTNKKLLDILVWNILDNAFKYNKNEWKIDININKKYILISDTWIWIEQKNIKKIFDNFYRENTSLKWYWIGLNISKKIADLLSYKIEVSSTLWEKTEFKIIF